jgi:hypothetical protein
MTTSFVPFADGDVPKAADFNQLAKSAFDNAASAEADRAQTKLDRIAVVAGADAALASKNTASTAAGQAVARAKEALDSAAAALATQTAINHRYRGALAADPATRTDGTANQAGDEYFSTASNLLKRWNGATWQASDISTANLAAAGGAGLLGDIGEFSGSEATNQQQINRERLSILRFLTPAKIQAYRTGVGDNDITAALNIALSVLVVLGGGELWFPRGAGKLTAEIALPGNIRCVGAGRRKCYPGLFSPTGSLGFTTLYGVHADRNLFRIFSAALDTRSNISFEGMSFATLESGLRPEAAFGFDGSGGFQRDYSFTRCAIHGFTSAFDTYGVDADPAMGVLKVHDCSINRNSYIARNITGQWNGFVFTRNEAGQNGIRGLDIKAQAVTISENILEGQPNPVRVGGTYRGIRISGNYFEANTGEYVVQLNNTLNAVIEANFWLSSTATKKLDLLYDVGTTVNDRIIPSTLGSFDLRTPDSAIDPTNSGNASAAYFWAPKFAKPSAAYLGEEFGGRVTNTPDGIHPDIPDSAGQGSTTTGTGIIVYTKSEISYPTGTFISVSILVSYIDAPTIPPAMQLRVNSTNTDGFSDPTFYQFAASTINLKNRTILYHGVVKATADVTSFQLYFYPFGLNPAAGLKCVLSQPAFYSLGTVLPSSAAFAGAGSSVQAMMPGTHIGMVSAAPVAGTWPAGWKLATRAPAASGFIGWTCTAAGAPGTWKTYGAISA